jgi:hypothetical protein
MMICLKNKILFNFPQSKVSLGLGVSAEFDTKKTVNQKYALKLDTEILGCFFASDAASPSEEDINKARMCSNTGVH